MIGWYNIEGTEIKKEYVKSKDTIYVTKNTEKLIVFVLGYGTTTGKCIVQNIRLKYKGNYQKRTATLAALPISYGFDNEHLNRSCEKNLRESLKRIDSLMKNCKADLIVLTECFYSRNCYADEEKTLSIDSPQINKMREKAKQHGIYLAFSFKEKTKEGKLYNTALLIDRQDAISAVYHKTHLTVAEYEAGMIHGDEIVVADTDFGRVEFAICWDFFFPELCRALQLKGAEIIINPSAGFMQEQSVMRARDNGVYVINSGMTFDTCKIFNPEGEMIASVKTEAAIADIDLNQEFPVRYLSVSSWASRKNIYINERRTDLYHCLPE